MTKDTAIRLFNDKRVRVLWDAQQEKWYFSIIDVIAILTDSPRPRKYWNALKTKLQQEGSELSHFLGQLKMQAEDGKLRFTDVADRICEILKEQGKDQKTLARSLGKSEAEISKWMRGTHNFTLKTLAKIEIVLGESLIEVSKKQNQTITSQATARHFPKLSSKSTVYSV